MMHSLNCPNCFAPLENLGTPGSTIQCPNCHTLLIQTEDSLVKPPETARVAGLCTANLSERQADIDHRVEFIREMVQAGNKIVAVKALRDVFKISKNKAQELVAAMAHGETVDTSLLPPVSSAVTYSPALDPILIQKLLDLVRKGEKIEAIKLLRKETGMGLKEARTVIDLLHANLSDSPGGILAETGLDLL